MPRRGLAPGGAARAALAALTTLAVLAGAAGCRRGAPGGAPRATPRDGYHPTAPAPAGGPRTFGGARPATVLAPRAGNEPLPLVLVLHGYGDTGLSLAAHLGYVALARRTRLVLVIPDGTPDRDGDRFWNATDACCNFAGRAVDDVAYLRGLVAEVRAAYPVDPARIYVVGLSNGGFMAHRLACEAADDFAAIVSIAGVPWHDAGRCRPRRAVSVLQVHADTDRTVRYAGGRDLLGRGGPPYPGAATTVARWAARAGCSGPPSGDGRELDLDPTVPGLETVTQAAPGCGPGLGVELWTMRGAHHVPTFGATFAPLSFAWLEAHARRPR